MTGKRVVLALLCSLCVFASTASADNRKTHAHRLLAVSGTLQNVEYTASNLRKLFHRELIAQRTDARIFDVATPLFNRQFNEQFLVGSIVTSLARELSAAELKQLLRWYESSTGKRVASAMQTHPLKIERRLNKRQWPILNRQRYALFEQLDKTMQSTENNFNAATRIAASLGYCIKRVVAPLSQHDLDRLHRDIIANSRTRGLRDFIQSGLAPFSMNRCLTKSCKSLSPMNSRSYRKNSACWSGRALITQSNRPPVALASHLAHTPAS